MKTKPTKHHTILWADDDPDDLDIICNIVDSFSDQYKVKTAENGCEILRYLEAINDPARLPCLLVLDINMPMLNGTETLARIKAEEKYRDLTIAVFSTSKSPSDRQLCEQYGVSMFTKPSSYDDFKKAVTELLRLCNLVEMPHASRSVI